MAIDSPKDQNPKPSPQEQEEEDSDDDDDDVELETPSSHREKIQTVFRRLRSGPVRIRVHDVIVKGNRRTNGSLIEAQVVEGLRSATTMQELLTAAGGANVRLKRLDVFDSVSITLDAGPPEISGTANVVIEVLEPENPLTGDLGIFTKPEAKTCSLEGSVKLKNLFGYADIWELSGSYGSDQTTELSTGVSLPRLKGLPTPLSARASLLSQDWLKLSSYKECLLGVSLGLVSIRNHDLAYNLRWRHLTNPSHMASKSIRRQLGHSLLSSIKYTYKLDRRDSHMRPTKGYALLSTTQVSGLGPDSKALRFMRQEFDLRAALPLGFLNTALNFGVAAGAIIPWGSGFLKLPSPLLDRFHIGGNTSPICPLGGPTSLLGFKTRGLGPTDLKRLVLIKSDDPSSQSSSERDVLGGDFAVTAFADLTFDLPPEILKRAGIHGHVFATCGNLAKITEDKVKDFSVQKLWSTARSSVGCGVIILTKLFRMEINYCHVLKQAEYDRAKTGVQLNFSRSS
ncbi:sorting and assembly machinery component 50 homolog B-like isoform X2 [Asparagus officinalis]|uniref:sorting and assembly machinery component 50 homolog B-like isoform X2 n=1 Tax=Asparagus officinalis TaxID=4686 RepID=UPI00098E6CF1|nr:sorting and assembly machinery component 50 homolog B-like isoform X2 [Asparagus officinalis]